MRGTLSALLALTALAIGSPIAQHEQDSGMAMDKPMSMPMNPDKPMSMPMDMGKPGGMPMAMKPAPKPKPKYRFVPPLFSTKDYPTKRLQVRYGPFTMAASNDTTLMKMPGMEDEGGVVDVLWNIGEPVKPCKNCVLKHANATLTYLDYSPANLNTGAWLHHMTLATVGPGRADVACPNAKNDAMGIIGGLSERFMVVHNDRNATFWGAPQDKVGYELKETDKLRMVLELKNENVVPKQVYFWVEYEFVPGAMPNDWTDVKPVWLDAQPCGSMSSEMNPPLVTPQFSVQSPGWISPFDAKLLTTVGHMHDGGANLALLVNGKKVCDSKPTYGQDKWYSPTVEAIRTGTVNMTHISHYSPCNAFGEIKKGDNLTLKADYDFAKYAPGLGDSGKPVGVMGIALTMLGVPRQ